MTLIINLSPAVSHLTLFSDTVGGVVDDRVNALPTKLSHTFYAASSVFQFAKDAAAETLT